MTKNEVIRTIWTKVEDIKQKDVCAVLGAYADVVLETLATEKEEKVPLPGIGAFKAKHVKERTGESALNGKAWSKPAHDELVFTISKDAKNLD